MGISAGNPDRAWAVLLLVFLFGVSELARAAEFTGRYGMTSFTALADRGDVGHTGNNDALGADQQTLRLMWDSYGQDSESALHLRLTRRQQGGTPHTAHHTSKLFRATAGAGD